MQPAAPAADPRESRIREAALKAGLTLTEFEAQATGAVFTVRWEGSSAATGGDFLQQLIADGIARDIDIPGPADQTLRHEGGRQAWYGRYTVRY
jgi:hypothetical protein